MIVVVGDNFRARLQGDDFRAHLDDEFAEGGGAAGAHLHFDVGKARIGPQVGHIAVDLRFLADQRSVDPLGGDQQPAFEAQIGAKGPLRRGKRIGINDRDIFIEKDDRANHRSLRS